MFYVSWLYLNSIQPIIVEWHVKLNNNKYSLNNQGLTSGSEIIRDHCGHDMRIVSQYENCHKWDGKTLAVMVYLFFHQWAILASQLKVH